MPRTTPTFGKPVRKVATGRTVIRRFVSLDADVDALAHELAGTANFSAFVNDAMREKAKRVQMTRLLDDLEAKFGKVDIEIKQKADELWKTLSHSTGDRGTR